MGLLSCLLAPWPPPRLTTEATATEVMVDTVWDTEVTERGQLMLTTVVAMEATAMEAMEATAMEAMAATAAMARGQLMLRLTMVVAMEATAMGAMAVMAAMARGLLMLTMVVPMAAMAAMDMATESNSS